MKKPVCLLISTLLLSVIPCSAKEDVPRGFAPLSELKEVQTKAIADKKLIVLVVKGKDDQCPNCAAALENGLKAVGSGVEKVFARAESIGQADAAGWTPTLQQRVKKNFISGAYVTFVVFNPEMSQIIAEAGRKELQNDKKATAGFKQEVQGGKKSLKGS